LPWQGSWLIGAGDSQTLTTGCEPDRLIDAGFTQSEVTSFVSPKWVPQWAMQLKSWRAIGGGRVETGRLTAPSAIR